MKKLASSPRLLLVTLAFVGLHTASSLATGVTHTTTTTSGNFSAATFTNGTPNSTTVGDTANYNGTATSSLALDIVVSLGQLENTGTGSFTLTAGGGTLTLDNMSGGNDPFGNAYAFLGTTSTGTLSMAAPIVLSDTNLDLGAANTTGGGVTISGALTATTAQSIFFRTNGTGTVADSGAIGATGSALTLSNLASGTGAVTLSGAIGGTSGTGAAVTIGNTATGSGLFTLSGTLGSSVTSITQNSVNSTMLVSGTNNGANGFAAAGATGTVTVTAGTLKVGGVNAFGVVNALTVNGGTFDLNGQSGNITVGSLTDGGVTTGSTVTDSGTSRQLIVGGSSTTTFGGLVGGAAGIQTAGTTNLTLTNTNTNTGLTTVAGSSTLVGANAQAFGNPATNALNQISISASTGTLSLLNNGGTGTVTGQTIVYGGPSGSATVAGYNVTAASGTINAGNNGNAGSTGNTIQLGQLTQSSTGQVNFTSANGYGINFAGGLNSNLGTATQTISTTATPVSFANIVGTSGRSLTILGTGTVTDNGSVTATGGTAYGLFVGATGSGGITGNLVLKGTGSTVTGGLTVSGGTATLFNSDSLGSSNAITLQQANATTLTTATLNLRNDADTNYGNAVTATSNAAAYNVDQATAAGTTPRTLTLGTLNTNQINTFTNGNGYNLAFGAVSSTSQATFTNNMANGTLTLASLASSSSATSNITFTFNGTSATATTSVGAISNPNAAQKVTQSGAGTLIFTGTNTYSGATTVNSGTLLVNGANNGAGAVTVSGVGTVLGGSGSIAGATTVGNGSQLLPGGMVGGALLSSNIASLRFGSTLAINGNYLVDLNPAAGATQTGGNNYDQVVTTGALTLSNTTSTLAFGTVNNTNLAVGQVFLIALNGGASAPGTFSNAPAASTLTDGSGDTFTISYTATGDSTAGNDISLTVLSVAPVPEPATWLGGLLIAGAVGWRQRKRVLVGRP